MIKRYREWLAGLTGLEVEKLLKNYDDLEAAYIDYIKEYEETDTSDEWLDTERVA